jgi:hypothetical protein
MTVFTLDFCLAEASVKENTAKYMEELEARLSR